MGCKCGRDLFLGENEIIRLNTQKPSLDMRKNKPTNFSSSTLTSIQSGKNIPSEPEINIVPFNSEQNQSNINITQNTISQIEKVEEDPNTKNNNYSKQVISLINKIRSEPQNYANIVEESIKNIRRTKSNQLIYYDIVKVALNRGEEAFNEAIDELKNSNPMQPLRFNPQLCIPLPENEIELRDKNFLKNKVDMIREKNDNIEIYFKDLISIPEVSVLLMVVDDNSKNVAKKRKILLNNNFKYIGVNSKFIGKNFVAHFSFSR
jgi:uncharacterized protein YkwD